MTYLANNYDLKLSDVKKFIEVAADINYIYRINDEMLLSSTGLCREFQCRMSDEITSYHIIEYLIPEESTYLNDSNKDGIYTKERHDLIQNILAFESPETLYAVWNKEYLRRNS